MIRKSEAAIFFALALGLATSSCSRTETGSRTTGSADTTAVATMTPVQRGQYLATIVGCHDCHTPGYLYGVPDMKRALSGSELGWKGPWGVSYARNLTPDVATGLGSWTDEEILRAIQNGVKKDGTPVMPPMPWPDLAHLTRPDAMALVAYLRSLPAVSHRVPDRVPPGGTSLTPVLNFPPPPAWDVPKKPAS
jgi:mono/diheme cytochrome c family protein